MANLIDSTTAATAADHTGPWPRLMAYLAAVSPKFIAEIFKQGLGNLAAGALFAFVLVLLLPTLSVLAMDGAESVLPQAAGAWLRDGVTRTIHRGYGIDEVRRTLKKEAANDVMAKLNSNNKSLDYVQYVEFYLTKGDYPKEIPANLLMGQHVEIKVRSVQVVSAPGFAGLCERADIGTAETVLDVSLERYRVESMPAMAIADARGNVNLGKDWWDKYMPAVKAHPSIKQSGLIGTVQFSKSPDYEKKMSPCSALKVEATLEVFKQDMALPS